MTQMGLLFKKLKALAGSLIETDKEVENESAVINMSRIYYCSVFAAILSLSYVLAFVFLIRTNKPGEMAWRYGITVCHSFLVLFFCLMFMISKKMKAKGKSSRLMFFLPYIYVVILILLGITMAAIDQLITTSISPLILISMTISVFMLIKPVYSLIIMIIGSIAIYFVLPLTMQSTVLLASVRINALSAMFLSFMVSVVMWRTNLSRILQEKIIHKQKEDLEQKNIELEYLAYYDSLTGTLNRRRFDELFEHEFSLMQRYGYESSITIMDIDFFKQINDSYGHYAGDEVLKRVSDILKANVRKDDLVARWGGEEFIILFSKSNLEQAFKTTEKLRKIIQDQTIEVKEFKIKLTASFGVAAIKVYPDAKKSIEKCFYKADSALYNAKQNGRNRVEMFTEPTK